MCPPFAIIIAIMANTAAIQFPVFPKNMRILYFATMFSFLTPKFAKQLIARFKLMRIGNALSPTYVPGPDSWHPGDPVPVQFKEERQKTRQRPGFSRGETNDYQDTE